MATTGVPSSAAALAVLLALATAAAADSLCPTGLYLYLPQCGRDFINQTYTTCKCMDTPCSEGPYLFKFFKSDRDPNRAYLFTEPGCRGIATVAKRTIASCRDFKYRSVKICPPCTSSSSAAAVAAAAEEEEEE